MNKLSGRSSLCAIPLAFLLLFTGTVRAEAIRELVGVQGAIAVSLEGIGIVTGLAGTGDKSAAAVNLLREFMSNRNFDFDLASLSTGNIALVRVSAEMPAFSRPGMKFGVTVTSIGDARSLVGGELLDCELFVNNSAEYASAIAKGQVIVGDNILTRGTVPDGIGSGAQQIAAYDFGQVMNSEGVVRLNLKRPNYSDATAIARQINQTPSLNPYLQESSMFAEAAPSQPVAYANDAGQVRINIPRQYRTDLTRYLANVLEVPVSVDRPATILVNRAKNAIVVTGDIRVNNAMVSLQDKTVTVRPETIEEPASYVLENETPRNLVEVEGPGSYADLQGLIDTLNAMGLTTDQVITVFEQLRAAGAISAELINQ